MIYSATKIIATVGPSTSSPKMMSRLIGAGINIFRLNFSHGDFEFHGRMIERIRQVSRSLGIPVGIMQDLPGPKIRIGEMPPDGIELKRGSRNVLNCGIVSYSGNDIPVKYRKFCRDVRKGHLIYINDGAIRLEALSIKGTRVTCLVEIGGLVTSHKGINIPGAEISTPTFTDYDRKCAKFGIERGVDFIAMSFVRSAKDIKSLRKFIEKRNGNQFIIAKIEKREAINDFENILRYTGGVMIARGDLGIELPIEQVPAVQKELIARCNRAGVPAITATQVLESMTANPRPTRAEASDASNAILDGTDALMLSGETAVGSFPVDAVKTLKAISHETERTMQPRFPPMIAGGGRDDVAECLARAVCESAYDLGIRVIATPTRSGHTARLISKYRPNARIIAFSQFEKTKRHLLLSWGTEPLSIDQRLAFDELVDRIKRSLVERKIARRGEKIIITAGSPGSLAGQTNLLVVEDI